MDTKVDAKVGTKMDNRNDDLEVERIDKFIQERNAKSKKEQIKKAFRQLETRNNQNSDLIVGKSLEEMKGPSQGTMESIGAVDIQINSSKADQKREESLESKNNLRSKIGQHSIPQQNNF